MAIFEYRGVDRSGKSVKGTVDADTARNARMKLKKDGISITDLRNKQKEVRKATKRGGPSQKGVGVEDISMMTRQLATLIKSNIPLVEALSAVSEQVENPTLRSVLAETRDAVNEGGSFNKTLANYPKIFNKIFCSMIEAGESSGTLDVILVRLAEFTESQNELKNKVRSAMLYPILMAVFTMAVLMLLFVSVIPKMTQVFESADMKLPWYSQVIIDISGVMVEYWHFLSIAIFSLVSLFFRWKTTPEGSKKWDVFILKVPVVGKLARLIAVSRFTRTLSTLLAGGVPMLNAMDIVKNVVDNSVLEKAIVNARDNISEGESVAGPLKKSGQFPPIVIHMIAIGEKTGELEKMLTQVSDSYDFQVKNDIDGLTSLLEPIMIIFMGIAIGIIVFAIMVPIFEMSNIQG